MTASPAEVEAAQKAMGCERRPFVGYGERGRGAYCGPHSVATRTTLVWTDRGCPLAQAVADAVVAAAQPRIAAETLREAAEAIRNAERTCTVNRTCHRADALTLDARAGGIEGRS